MSKCQRCEYYHTQTVKSENDKPTILEFCLWIDRINTYPKPPWVVGLSYDLESEYRHRDFKKIAEKGCDVFKGKLR